MYLSVTQILQRLGKARNKKNADIVRNYFKNSGEAIGGVFRVDEKVFEEYFGELTYELERPKSEPLQINSVTNFESTILEQEKRIQDLEIENTWITNRLEKAEKAISNIIEIFYNVNKLKGE